MQSDRPPKLASNLQVASSRDLVYVDRAGHVRSPLRYRVLQGAYYGGLGVLLLIELALVYTFLWDDGVLAVTAAMVVALVFSWAGWAISRQLALSRAQRAQLAGRLDEAEGIYRSVLRAPLLPPKYRTAAEQGIAGCRMIAGRHEEGLVHLQSALRRHGHARNPRAQLARYAEIYALVNVGRLDEARARLAALGPVPEGEYFRINHWSAELYLALREGTHAIEDDELHRRASAALAITSAAPLLGLLAWAFDQRGDDEMVALLLAEARDRHPGQLLSGPLPLLDAWMEAQPAGTAGIDDAAAEGADELETAEVASRRARRTAADPSLRS